MMLKFAGFLASVAAVPEVVWQQSGSTNTATLEFCTRGRDYGYRLPGQQCISPGPTIRMAPGNSYVLTLKNTASEDTNLHTHGLHISGAGNADDVTRVVPGGDCMNYHYDMRADSMGGTFFYHAHKHTSTLAQVSRGAFGLIVVDDGNLNPPNTDVGLWLDRDHEKLLQVFGGQGSQNLEFISGEWYRLRLSLVSTTALPTTVQFTGCEVRQVASDGVWLSSIPGPASNQFDSSGVGRTDFAIKCNTNADIRVGGSSASSITVTSGSVSAATPWANNFAWSPQRPNHLRNLLNEVVPANNYYSVSMSGGNLNGQKYDEAVALRDVQYGEVHEWTISNSLNHPFHLHVYHMQIVEPGGCDFFQEGEFFDTIAAQGNCAVRFLAINYGQRVTMHCHVLRHEDGGSMGWVDVVGSGVPTAPTNDVNPYTCANPPAPTAPPGPNPTPAPTTPPGPNPTPAPTAPPPTAPPPTDPPGTCAQVNQNCRNTQCCPQLTCNPNSNKCRP